MATQSRSPRRSMPERLACSTSLPSCLTEKNGSRLSQKRAFSPPTTPSLVTHFNLGLIRSSPQIYPNRLCDCPSNLERPGPTLAVHTVVGVVDHLGQPWTLPHRARPSVVYRATPGWSPAATAWSSGQELAPLSRTWMAMDSNR